MCSGVAYDLSNGLVKRAPDDDHPTCERVIKLSKLHEMLKFKVGFDFKLKPYRSTFR